MSHDPPSPIGHNGPPDDDDDRAGNWFCVSRTTFAHPIVGIHNRPYTEFEAWLSMLAMASYETRRVMNKGAVVVLDPGDLMAAHGYLAQRWMWSVDKVRWFLKRLQTEAMITRATQKTGRNTNQIQVITICNYTKYQNTVKPEHQALHQAEPQANTKPTPSQHQELNHKPLNQTKKLTRAREVVEAEVLPPAQRLDMSDLLDACNGSLDNPVNCQGLLSEAVPRMWIDSGCDLERDILPTLRAVGHKAHGKRIRSWDYFTRAIADARDRRVRGMSPPPDLRSTPPTENRFERNRRMVREAMERQGGKA